MQATGTLVVILSIPIANWVNYIREKCSHKIVTLTYVTRKLTINNIIILEQIGFLGSRENASLIYNQR